VAEVCQSLHMLSIKTDGVISSTGLGTESIWYYQRRKCTMQ